MDLEDRTTPSNFHVTGPGDAGPGTLRQAIVDANNNPGADTIDFDQTVFGTPKTIALNSTLTITDDLTITGPGTNLLKVDGGGAVRDFDSTAANLTLSGFTVAHGLAANSTGGGLRAGGIVTLDDMVFDSNVATGVDFVVDGAGGGIAMTANGFLKVNDSTISGNTAGRSGGGIFCLYGGLILQNSTVTGNATTFTGTYFGYSGGGGLAFLGTPSGTPPAGFTSYTAVIENSTIVGNTTTGSGGGIIGFNVFYTPGTFLVQDCTITGNNADASGVSYFNYPYGGGGVSIMFGGSLVVQNSVISGNTNATSPDIQSVYSVQTSFSLIGNPNGFSEGDGTGDLAPGTDPQLGALADNGGPTQTMLPAAGSPLIDVGDNALIPAGVTNDQRGFGYFRSYNSTVDIGSVEVQPLGFPFALSTPPAVDNTSIGQTSLSFDVTFADPTGTNRGIQVGGIINNNALIRVTGPNGFDQLATYSSINNNTDGVVRLGTFIITPPGGSWDNLDDGIYTISTLANQVFDEDGNSIPAGAIGTLVVDIQPILVTNANDSGPGSLRAAITTANASSTPDEIDFDPAFFSTHREVDLVSPLPQISANGGSLSIVGPGAANLVLNAGGQFRVLDSRAPSLNVSGLTITGGRADDSANLPNGEFGGGLRAGGIVTLDQVVVTGNTASGPPSAYIDVGAGGGIGMLPSSTLTISNSTISGNTADDKGGGIFLRFGGSLTVIQSTISGNSSTPTGTGNYYGLQGGGGIYEVGQCSIVIRSSTIANNTTTGSGGGIGGFLSGTTGGLILLENSTISGNNADATGSVAGNYYGGGGIGLEIGSDTIIVLNSIVSGNTNGNGPDILNTGNTYAYYSAIGDNTGFILTGGSNNVPFGTDLMLGPLQHNGGPTETMSPLAGSPLIDAGSNGYIFGPSDQRGFSRIYNGTVDIGAVEVQPPTVTIDQAPTQADPTNAAPIQFIVVFDEPVTGFTASDIDLSSSTVGGTLVATITQAGPTTYTVAITGMNGEGTVVASIDADAVTDLSSGLGNLASTSTDNSVSFDNTAPTVTINQAVGQNDPTNSGPINFDVVFSEPVTGFDTSDISFNGSTLTGLTAILTQTGPSTYTLSVSGMNGTGDVVVSIPAGAVMDLAGNSGAASTSTDNKVHFDNVPPTVTIDVHGAADPVGGVAVVFDVVFNEAVVGFDGTKVDLGGSTASGTLVATVTGSGPAYTVTITGMTSGGIIEASIDAGVVTDLAGNLNLSSTSTKNSVNYVHSGIVQFSSAIYSQTEHNSPTITITVTRTDGSDGALSVNYATGGGTATAGSDYVATNGTLNWAAGDTTSKIFNVQILDDTIFEGDETVGLTLSNISLAGALGTPSAATLTITDYEEGTLSFSAPVFNTSESDTPNHVVTHATITVTRTLGSNGAVSIDYASNDGTAHSSGASVDYTPVSGTLNWADGDSAPKTFTVDIIDDTANEGKELINLTLRNATGSPLIGTVNGTLAIAPSDGFLLQPIAKKNLTTFSDSDGDLVTVTLGGKVGSASVYMTDPDGNGKGPIEVITLTGTDPAKSSLTVKVKKPKGGAGNVLVDLGAVTGSGLRSLSAPTADLNGDGINFNGYLGSLTLHGVKNGADIITIGGLSTQKTGMRLGVVGDGTTINVANPISSLSATSFGDGAIIAPSVGSITTKGRPANIKKGDPGDHGDFNADITLSGAGVLPKKSTLGSLSVKGDMNANTINVASGKVGSIRVRGNVIGSLIQTAGAVSSMSALTFHGSRLFVGYSGADDGSGTFNPAGQLGTFSVSGKIDGFQDSHVIASSIRSASLASVDTTNSGIKFGFIADVLINQVKVKSPAFSFTPKANGTSELLDDFQVKIV